MTEFGCSEIRILSQRARALSLSLYCLLLLGPCATGFHFFLDPPRNGCCGAFFVVVSYAQLWIPLAMVILCLDWLERKWVKKVKLVISEDRIVQECGKRKIVGSWNAIAKIERIETPKGVPFRIHLHLEDKNEIVLLGLSDMAQIDKLLRERAPENVSVVTKRLRFDRDSPAFPILLTMCIFLFFCGIIVFGTFFRSSFEPVYMQRIGIGVMAVVSIPAGVFLLVNRSVRRTDPAFRWFLTITGLMALIYGVLGILAFFQLAGGK